MDASMASDLQKRGIGRLGQAIRQAWSAETSIDGGWTIERPSLGQCAVTALVVQDYVGGELVRADVEGVSHYWNRLPDTEVDLTRDQFTRFSPRQVETRPRDYVLSFPDTARRYRLLAARVRSRLGDTESLETERTLRYSSERD